MTELILQVHANNGASESTCYDFLLGNILCHLNCGGIGIVIILTRLLATQMDKSSRIIAKGV